MLDFTTYEAINYPSSTAHHKLLDVTSREYWEISLKQTAKKHLTLMSDDELDADWKLNEFFGTIAIINLPKDTERLSRTIGELQHIGVYTYEIFPAIDGRSEVSPHIWQKFVDNPRTTFDINTPEGKLAFDRLRQGIAGCYLSHYYLIQQAKAAFDSALMQLEIAAANRDPLAIDLAKDLVRKYSSILILEDDNGFGIVDSKGASSSKKGVGRLLRQALIEMPDGWDMFYFMCAAHEKTKSTSKHLRRLKRSVFQNAYVINHTMYEPLIKALKQIEDPLIRTMKPVDKAISFIHHQHKVFAIYPSIAFQYNGISNIDSNTSDKLGQWQPIL